MSSFTIVEENPHFNCLGNTGCQNIKSVIVVDKYERHYEIRISIGCENFDGTSMSSSGCLAYLHMSVNFCPVDRQLIDGDQLWVRLRRSGDVSPIAFAINVKIQKYNGCEISETNCTNEKWQVLQTLEQIGPEFRDSFWIMVQEGVDHCSQNCGLSETRANYFTKDLVMG